MLNKLHSGLSESAAGRESCYWINHIRYIRCLWTKTRLKRLCINPLTKSCDQRLSWTIPSFLPRNSVLVSAQSIGYYRTWTLYCNKKWELITLWLKALYHLLEWLYGVEIAFRYHLRNIGLRNVLLFGARFQISQELGRLDENRVNFICEAKKGKLVLECRERREIWPYVMARKGKEVEMEEETEDENLNVKDKWMCSWWNSESVPKIMSLTMGCVTESIQPTPPTEL